MTNDVSQVLQDKIPQIPSKNIRIENEIKHFHAKMGLEVSMINKGALQRILRGAFHLKRKINTFKRSQK